MQTSDRAQGLQNVCPVSGFIDLCASPSRPPGNCFVNYLYVGLGIRRLRGRMVGHEGQQTARTSLSLWVEAGA